MDSPTIYFRYVPRIQYRHKVGQLDGVNYIFKRGDYASIGTDGDGNKHRVIPALRHNIEGFCLSDSADMPYRNNYMPLALFPCIVSIQGNEYHLTNPDMAFSALSGIIRSASTRNGKTIRGYSKALSTLQLVRSQIKPQIRLYSNFLHNHRWYRRHY